jgi:hypothetical protein
MYHIVPIGQGISGFVYQSRKGRYHVFICSSLSPQAQKRVFFHEAWHIIRDMPRQLFIVGIDMQNEVFEIDAERFASAMCHE